MERNEDGYMQELADAVCGELQRVPNGAILAAALARAYEDEPLDAEARAAHATAMVVWGEKVDGLTFDRAVERRADSKLGGIVGEELADEIMGKGHVVGPVGARAIETADRSEIGDDSPATLAAAFDRACSEYEAGTKAALLCSFERGERRERNREALESPKAKGLVSDVAFFGFVAGQAEFQTASEIREVMVDHVARKRTRAIDHVAAAAVDKPSIPARTMSPGPFVGFKM